MDKQLPTALLGDIERRNLEIQKDFERTARNGQAFLEEAESKNTRRTFETSIRYVQAWFEYSFPDIDFEWPLHPVIIEKFVIDHLCEMQPSVDARLVENGYKKKPGTVKVSTLRTRLWAIAKMHARIQGHQYRKEEVYTPRVKEMLNSTRNYARHERKRTEPLQIKELNRILERLDQDGSPRAILLATALSVAFTAGGLRRSEIHNLEMQDVKRIETDEDPGYRFELTIQYSKTRGAGEQSEIQPVRGPGALRLQQWLDLREELGIEGGRLFRTITEKGLVNETMSLNWFYEAIKKVAADIGLNPDDYSPHSIRAGFITTAHDLGYSLKDIMAICRHKTVSVHLGYIQERDKMIGEVGNILSSPTSRESTS